MNLTKPILILFAVVVSQLNFNHVRAQKVVPYNEGDYIINHFKFEDGNTLDSLRLHYYYIGTPHKNSAGIVDNFVLITHGTGGSGSSLLSENFAGQLFRNGQPLDASKYFIVLPDGIGHGKSSKPSDGLRMKFPTYTYDDMVDALYLLITDHLKVNHARLITGTSMGGMQTWVWGERYPDFMDALMPLASAPVEIAGRNRMLRKMMIDAIKEDPNWKQGNYEQQPAYGIKNALNLLAVMGSAPLQWQKDAPTRETAEAYLAKYLMNAAKGKDANDMIYQFESSRKYNPAPHLNKIKVPVLAINSADDQVNPPELKILDTAILKIPNSKFVLLPITSDTRGHGTHSLPKIWSHYLIDFLKATEPFSQDTTSIQLDPSKKVLIVQASCGQCQFKMEGKGCTLAVKIKGKSYFVDNANIDSFGDAHASMGFCNAIKKAKVQGEVVNNKFVASYFKLIE